MSTSNNTNVSGSQTDYFEKALKCVSELQKRLPGTNIRIAQGNDAELKAYYTGSQIFNLRLQFNPLAIVYCRNAEEVSIAYKTAIANEIPVRVRGGGHDHEGECTGTNVILIDLSEINYVEVDHATGIARIGAGNRFIKLTTDLANQDVMIAHGTCATVCVSGYTFGGGWGPWTRKMGMNCEYLKGATIMLGDGNVINIDEKNGNVPDLLWALRGGGGMSYGIVTELRLQTFPLPKELIKFELEWNPYNTQQTEPQRNYPTIQVLQAWENAIQSAETPRLIGTNLKINGIPFQEPFHYKEVYHNCVMYGYFEGNREQLNVFIEQFFGKIPPKLTIDGEGGTDPKENYGKRLMSRWDRESFAVIRQNLLSAGLLEGKPIPPDLDDPAPHKITSRLVNKSGLVDAGYEQLLRSLSSPLIYKTNRALGLFTYVTLGAITGDYYRTHPVSNVAFPYRDRLYTIQYQTWWNTEKVYKELYQDSPVYDYINRAMDWIETSRNYVIPGTSGAFISFKDSAIPTRVYFDKSYDRLKQIKEEFSRDPYNHLRSRKTIV
jgi:hypothetical protein